MKILLAEDNEDNYEVVKSNLKKLQNIELIWATNGKETLQKLSDGVVPDLFLIDIEMPVMNGKELIISLKNNQLYKNIPIIVITASIFAEMKSSYLSIGANDILEKPFSRSQFLELVGKYGAK